MIHIAVCDDSIDELSNMANLLNQYQIARHLNCAYAVFQNGFELIATLDKGKRFDIYCLDIIMPAFGGIEIAKEVRGFDKDVPIIFFTSSEEFALESYSVNAVDYVIKPIKKDKLFHAFDTVLERIKFVQEEAIVVKSVEGIQRIMLSTLVYAEVIGKCVFYYLISGRVIECIESFAPVCENLLKYSSFIKPHRSYIVNMRHIDNVGNSKITMQTTAEIPIAQGKTREMRELYLTFQMEGE